MPNANWPRDVFGVDLNRAVPNALVALDAGVVITRPSLRPLPNTEGIIPGPYVVTDASEDIPAGTTFVVVNRTDPGVITTTLNFPSVLVQVNAILVFDWSEGFSQHTINITPASGETVMQISPFPLTSVDDGSFKVLTSGIFYPIASLLGWGAR